MNNKQKQIHTIDTVFPLIFILLFGFCALALVLSGAHVYQDTTDGLKQNYTIRTAATYLQEKVREYSSESQVEVLSQDGQTVLALYEEGDSGYVTYIYLYKGKLWELFTKNCLEKRAGTCFSRYIFCYGAKGGLVADRT